MTDLARREAEFLLYQAEDGRTRVEVRFVGETVWLSLGQMAELFQRDKSVISRHVKNVFDEGELTPEATVAKSATVQREGEREVTREVEYYNLDVIISVGYRVKSQRGTQFRIWATQRLREYIVKGFTLDDERLKRSGGGNYFDELLARIRAIRSSEKVFWRKVLEIYATSIDYDPRVEASQLFFKTIQNKMHWAAHGHTAAEVIVARADAAQPNMGLTSWTGEVPRKADVAIAKTLSDKTARTEFGLTQPQIVQAVRAGKLQCPVNSAHGNPYLRLLRREVEALVEAERGGAFLKQAEARAELSRIEQALKRLRAEVKDLEIRKARLERSSKG